MGYKYTKFIYIVAISSAIVFILTNSDDEPLPNQSMSQNVDTKQENSSTTLRSNASQLKYSDSNKIPLEKANIAANSKHNDSLKNHTYKNIHEKKIPEIRPIQDDSKLDPEVVLKEGINSDATHEMNELQNISEQELAYTIEQNDYLVQYDDEQTTEESNVEIDPDIVLKEGIESDASREMTEMQKLAEQDINYEIRAEDYEARMVNDPYGEDLNNEGFDADDALREGKESPASRELNELQNDADKSINEDTILSEHQLINNYEPTNYYGEEELGSEIDLINAQIEQAAEDKEIVLIPDLIENVNP